MATLTRIENLGLLLSEIEELCMEVNDNDEWVFKDAVEVVTSHCRRSKR